MNLEELGWNADFHDHYLKHQNDKLIPARVSFQGKGVYRLLSEKGELLGRCAGSFAYDAARAAGLPVCGDWVLADRPVDGKETVIRFLLPRRTSFSRKQAGTAIAEQVIASNIDTVFLVSGLDADYNPRRIERYLAVARESGADPVIVLNKADVCAEVSERLEETAALAPGIHVFAASATDGLGMEQILGYAGTGKTLALLGSSGVGKSSLVNRLLGIPVQEIRVTDRVTGRGLHTTTSRHLLLIPSGGLIMDTPGMRELQIWSADTGLDSTFSDIADLAEQCRFRDCRHQSEPGCQVQAAVADGTLDSGRLAGYFKLLREARYFELKSTRSANWIEKDRWKKIMGNARKQLKKQRFQD